MKTNNIVATLPILMVLHLLNCRKQLLVEREDSMIDCDNRCQLLATVLSSEP